MRTAFISAVQDKMFLLLLFLGCSGSLTIVVFSMCSVGIFKSCWSHGRGNIFIRRSSYAFEVATDLPSAKSRTCTAGLLSNDRNSFSFERPMRFFWCLRALVPFRRRDSLRRKMASDRWFKITSSKMSCVDEKCFFSLKYLAFNLWSLVCSHSFVKDYF